MNEPRTAAAAALKLLEAGACAEAEEALRRWLAGNADDVDALGLLGLACRKQNKFDDSARAFHRAARLQPKHETLSNFAAALSALGRFDEAILRYRQALAFRPDNAETHRNLGVCLAKARRPAEAEAELRTALRIQPDSSEALNNLWALLIRVNRVAEAGEISARLVKVRGDDAEAWTAHGVSLHRDGQIHPAIAAYSRALELNPNLAKARHNRGVALLAVGRFAEGWPDFAARWGAIKTPKPQFPVPAWDGSDPNGKRLLLWTEQGLGDAIHFVRYARDLSARGATVVFQSPRPLCQILAATSGIARFVAEGEALGAIDAQASIVDLPMLLGINAPEQIAQDAPYVFANPKLVERWRAPVHAIRGLRVGVCWRGNQQHPEDQRRSFAPAMLNKLAAIPGVRLISLQKEPAGNEIEALDFELVQLPGMDEQSGPFMDSAAVMRHLDLVVSCDTSIGHLAGALGVPVWLALARPFDWRWLENRDDTPWYPTMRLFRQRQAGDWPSVFNALAASLQRLAARRSVRIEISPGELFDRLSILQIKYDRISDAAKRQRVADEMQELSTSRDLFEPLSPAVTTLVNELQAINAELWDLEDEIRACERAGSFGGRFLQTARMIPQLNDRRAELKRALNELFGSQRGEEKVYHAP